MVSFTPTSHIRSCTDELMLDGNAVSTSRPSLRHHMDGAGKHNGSWTNRVDKNVIDEDESPQTAELERRCVHMLAGLWHAPGAHAGVGC